ncbi:hypothetical protein [Pseudomonas aegrilactucae]|uniref:Uncharacterized protein n=1 Tax=Pseudomonas aegrilactucae TaxID=2854028 RepID=A0A9Q3ADA1_9PSED|nr:hypothetical protein [Pseudomonas aegrilactucae]MBV6286160.1 hypothetical protein [Pseudomonas aegrilactucae]
MTDQSIAQGQDPAQPSEPEDIDPLGRPQVVPEDRPEDWKDPASGDGVPDDEDMPLPND